MLGKNRLKKVKKTIFYSQEYLDQKVWGKKTRETIFPETHQWCDQKMLGKNHRKYVRTNVFLYSHKHRYQTMGEKRAKQFFQKHRNMFEQKCWEKIVANIFEKKFYIHSNIVTKKWWEKMRETIFPETHEWFEQKCRGKKSSPKSAKNVFLHSHEYRF